MPKRPTTPTYINAKTEVILYKSVECGKVYLYNNKKHAFFDYIAPTYNNLTNTFDDAEREVIFKTIHEYFVSRVYKRKVADDYEVPCGRELIVNYTKLYYSDKITNDLKRMLKVYHAFLLNIKLWNWKEMIKDITDQPQKLELIQKIIDIYKCRECV
tara:strand:+ start:225 stop:695 length:471 start_codon:yes stop_codon:yes gene_type:complete